MQKDKIIGLKIAYYRKLNGFTQEELAEKIVLKLINNKRYQRVASF